MILQNEKYSIGVEFRTYCRERAAVPDFYEMLVEKNKVMNLTAITEFEDVVEKHF